MLKSYVLKIIRGMIQELLIGVALCDQTLQELQSINVQMEILFQETDEVLIDMSKMDMPESDSQALMTFVFYEIMDIP